MVRQQDCFWVFQIHRIKGSGVITYIQGSLLAQLSVVKGNSWDPGVLESEQRGSKFSSGMELLPLQGLSGRLGAWCSSARPAQTRGLTQEEVTTVTCKEFVLGQKIALREMYILGI